MVYSYVCVGRPAAAPSPTAVVSRAKRSTVTQSPGLAHILGPALFYGMVALNVPVWIASTVVSVPLE